MDHWRITVLELFVTGIFLVFEVIFGWPYSHALTWLLMTVTAAVSIWIIVPRIGIVLGGIVLIIGLVFLSLLPPTETETHGWLIPGTQPIPRENACFDKVPDRSIAVLIGNQGIYTDANTLKILRFCDRQILWITRSNRGIFVNADVFDNQILAQIRNGEFYLNQNNMFRMERPDRQTLGVYGQDGQERLRVEFLNPNAVRVMGKFEVPDCSCGVEITSNWISSLDKLGNIHGMCMNIERGRRNAIGCGNTMPTPP